jgi:GDP-L-fucose synthase
MLEAARRARVKKAVYTSSIGAYSSAELFVEEDDTPTNPPMDMFPGWAKRMAEMQIEAYKIQYGIDNFAMVRPCNVYGPRDNFNPNNAMVIPSLMSRIESGEAPLKVWGNGSSIRDFAYSSDVAAGVIQALFYGTRGSFVNLGSGVGTSIKQLVETLAKVTPFEYEFDCSKPSGFPCRVMDLTRAKDWINYQPKTSLLDGLNNTWRWYLDNKNTSDKRHNYFVPNQ